MKGEGFNTSRGAQQMFMYQKSMFDRYFYIFSLENFGENVSKSFFSCTYISAKRHATFERFKNTASMAKSNVMLTSWNYVCTLVIMTSVFVTAPECLYIKP